MFKAEHPEIKVSYSLFTQLRLKNMCKISSAFSESCLCVYCLIIHLKLHALNRAVTVSGLGVEMKISNERGLFNILLCSKQKRFALPQFRLHLWPVSAVL